MSDIESLLFGRRLSEIPEREIIDLIASTRAERRATPKRSSKKKKKSSKTVKEHLEGLSKEELLGLLEEIDEG